VQEARTSRRLLESALGDDPGNPYAAAALAGVYMDLVERNGRRDLLSEVRRLAGVVYARDPSSREGDALFGRLKSLEQR
jgi:hypothetical protein